jgi:cytochrome c oxidase subunit III
MTTINNAAATMTDRYGEWTLPSRGRVAMFGLIATESSLFTIFVIAYLFYVGKSLTGPYPRDVLDLPIIATICLLSSSGTLMMAERALREGRVSGFGRWWAATIGLGAFFLGATALEWRRLIYELHLTISTNLFGTTFYSLVGFHAFHVTVGLIMLTLVLVLTARGAVGREHAGRIEVLGLYWHFVDAVWVVVFTVVYVIGR